MRAVTTLDAMNARYSHGHHRSVLRSHGVRTAADSAAYLLPHLRPGMAVLDVGCGPGTITLDLADVVGPTGRVVGVDSAPAAIEAARAEAARRAAGVSTTASAVEFAVADVGSLPYADATYDVVHAHQVLQHLADPVAALREMTRVARPGGLIAARDADYAAMTWHPASAAMSRWLTAYRELARRNGGEPDAGRRLRAWAHAAGLAEVVTGADAWGYTAAEETAWWARVWADRARHSSFAEQCVELGLASAAELEEIATGWLAWGEHQDAWFGMLHGQILARVPDAAR